MSYDAFAELYDAAFEWESEPEVMLPVYRALGSPRRVLEVACGPARLLATLVAQGAQGVGIDISRPMLRLARRRLAERSRGAAYLVVQADMREFALREPWGGAFCAVGSFGHLTTFDDAARHLRAMRRALAPGATYAVQLRLQPIRDTPARPPNAHSSWQFEHAGERLSYSWFGRGIDAPSARETQVSRIERLSGPDRGDVIETEHVMRIWDWPSWCALLRSERFEQRAAHDPGAGSRALPLDDSLHEHPLAWHLIVAR
jgi:SAM-dependent methyltransferase